ncbi:MAG: GNAT family N-acetyltransferase [Ktedonobacteraceae bacterium]|nr:GNAT family N-acetyltransferase [Ktedonobacteraceae bacterium]
MPSTPDQVRLLTGKDRTAIEQLLRTSEYVYQRFMTLELPLLLKHYPAVGLLHGRVLHGFLLSQNIVPPTAWIGGFGVSWTESRNYLDILFTLLDQLKPHLTSCGVQYLHYSGNNSELDWLYRVLLTRNFIPYRMLYAYDKYDYSIPTAGNQQVHIRPVCVSITEQAYGNDMAALLAIEEVCFEQLWRYDAISFSDIATTHPYFVVAELDGKVVGYQFNAVEDECGYFVRIAVHPTFAGRGIGTRLVAEAIRFFAEQHVQRIMLNTQEENVYAHRLYERFGFVRLEHKGFVLRKHLT